MEFFDGAMQEFGRRLRAYRKNKRLTLRDMAENLGVHISSVEAWERGYRCPREQTAYEIDDMLGLGVFVHSPEMDKRFKI